ncbi:MAG: UDP-N-acetylglucosamine pyrophosphorylase [Lachnospiraceae bacterium]|nr:UDP-N-acetylglucosamine pyrophosphorylase [Lachnospiraceae bacterium]
MLDMFKIDKYLDVNKTLAQFLFEGIDYPWEVLPRIEAFIMQLGPMLPAEEFDRIGENVWIAKSATVADSASITGPCIIDANAQIRHCAFIRGNAIIGKGAVVGNSCEIKNSLLFDEVEVPHYNYVGDSVLGYKAHLGAGAITSNIKNDKKNVVIKFPLGEIETGLRKLGAVVGDGVQVGCNTVLNPGTVIGKNTRIYPLNSVRGWVDENSIYKKEGTVTEMI